MKLQLGSSSIEDTVALQQVATSAGILRVGCGNAARDEAEVGSCNDGTAESR